MAAYQRVFFAEASATTLSLFGGNSFGVPRYDAQEYRKDCPVEDADTEASEYAEVTEGWNRCECSEEKGQCIREGRD